MEESPCKQFKGDRHKGMLTIGQETLLQIRMLTGKGLQVKQGWSLFRSGIVGLLEDNRDTIIPTQASQEIPTLATFQSNDIDVFDSDCDYVPSAKETQCSEQPSVDNDSEVDITSDSNIISYEQNEKVADFKKQIHLLKQQLNATIESHKTLSTTIEYLKKEFKQKEDKYLDEVINLQMKNKALDNVVYKIARRKVHVLYDGKTIIKTRDTLFVTDTEETLDLAEESRIKMLAKQNDPSLKEKKVNVAPVDYVALNKLSEHFVKHFMP
ncbi:hypothetical protein Tco_1455231 [Tanacetum coccineum]